MFRYLEEGKYVCLNSSDINRYLREVSGTYISAKDFRTWGGTVLTVKFEPLARTLCEENPRKKLETTLVKLVARELNNTVSVCRKYYIHPKIIDIAVKGKLPDYRQQEEKVSDENYRQEEFIVMNILNS